MRYGNKVPNGKLQSAEAFVLSPSAENDWIVYGGSLKNLFEMHL